MKTYLFVYKYRRVTFRLKVVAPTLDAALTEAFGDLARPAPAFYCVRGGTHA
jgi:hypothetical protein